MTPARAALGVCGLGLVVALLVVFGQSQTQIASTDRVDNNAFVIGVPGGSRLCQDDEIVPSGTVALRMTIGTYGTPGPRFRFTITVPRRRGGGRRLLASAALPYGWKQGVVSIPIAPHVHGAYGNATVCMDNLGRTNVALAGSTVLGDYGFNDYLNGHYVLTEARIDYLLPGRPSWFDMIGTIAERMTLGKGSYVGWAGWIAPLLLMIAAVVLIVRVLAAEERRRVRRTRAAAARRLAALRRLLARLPRAAAARRLAALRRVLARLPRAAYVCALIGLLNTLAWSVIVPPFEVPDENAHYAYVQLLVENGKLPQATAVFNGQLSPREDAILEVIHAFRLPGQPENPAPITSVDQSMIQQVESEHLSARGTGTAISASANPPLYYALEAVPYALSPSGSVLDRLALMRVLSAVFAGLTVLFAFLFLRELMPGHPLGVDGRSARGRAPAALRLHLVGPQQRRAALHLRGCALLHARTHVPPRADAAARARDRRRAGRRPAREVQPARVRARGGRSRWRSGPGAPGACAASSRRARSGWSRCSRRCPRSSISSSPAAS